MEDMLEVIRRSLSMIWRHRWVGLTVAWLLGLSGILLVTLRNDIYEATARVYVDTTSQLRLLLDDQIVETNVEDQLRFVRQALLGTPQLERVARETNLLTGAESADEVLNAVAVLASRIQIVSSAELSPPRQWGRPQMDDTYLIRYAHSDRGVAIAVVEKILEIFVEDTLGEKRTSSKTAGEFLMNQIREYESRLQAAEQALAEFNRRNYDRLPSLQGGYFQSMQQSREELEEALQELDLAESRLSSIESQIRGESPRLSSSGELDPNSLEGRILENERRLDDLRLRYTDQHPDVVALSESLVLLRESLEQRNARDTDRTGAVSNPVFQALQIARNEAESEVESLRAVVVQRQKRVAELQSLVNEMPEVEAELVRLNRDYDVVQARYQSLLDSLEREKLSREVLEAEEVEFRVIDPPHADIEPVSPKREILLLAVLLFSAGGGMAVAYGFAQLRPTIDSAAILEQYAGFEVIGTVNMIAIPGSELRSSGSRLVFFAAAGSLIALMLGIVVFEAVGPGVRGIF